MGTPASGPAASALYWHIGAIHTRFGMVTDRRVYGSNSALTGGSIYGGSNKTLVRYPS
ncbi:hypothetical protein SCWH03_09320 [Streptomyces pacificus]|uniref:Uncharacterized protein n=1 Tax=Streptomyces pacificus TaxID=2705029 RepID=A0A6A0AQ01_9ACTN|nr:hypothetical protein SCWH03_09320 [Streptomyces pacificus]